MKIFGISRRLDAALISHPDVKQKQKPKMAFNFVDKRFCNSYSSAFGVGTRYSSPFITIKLIAAIKKAFIVEERSVKKE